MMFRRLLTVLRFETHRTLSLPRMFAAAALAMFPPALIGAIQYQGGGLEQGIRAAIALYALIPCLTCAMGLLLWAAPAIHAEVEGGAWPYLAVRPGAKTAVLFGKYLTAVAWTALAAWLSLAACLAIIRPEEHPLRTLAALSGLVGLACLAYGSLFTLFGVLFLRRAIVAAVAYTFIVEVLTTLIPTTIQQFTVQYHLRCLLVKWLQWGEFTQAMTVDGRLLYDTIFSEAPPWQHVAAIVGFAAVLLIAATIILRRRELVKPEEN